MVDKEKIVITDSLKLTSWEAEEYISHAICTGGRCDFKFNNHDFTLQRGDVMIVRKGKLLEGMHSSDDFKVINALVAMDFVAASAPIQSNYGVKGQLSLFLNPVMHLTPEQYDVCLRDFDNIRFRLSQTDHHFRTELLMNAVQTMILDFFDFHSHLYGESDVSVQSARIMNVFLSLLENGEYRKHREVAWYADRLCVTPKYLSQVTKEVSGCSANYWINRYTVLDIMRMLRDKSLTLVNIADAFHFSSPAYFSRYVQRFLGVSPSEYRNTGK